MFAHVAPLRECARAVRALERLVDQMGLGVLVQFTLAFEGAVALRARVRPLVEVHQTVVGHGVLQCELLRAHVARVLRFHYNCFSLDFNKNTMTQLTLVLSASVPIEMIVRWWWTAKKGALLSV